MFYRNTVKFFVCGLASVFVRGCHVFYASTVPPKCTTLEEKAVFYQRDVLKSMT